MEVVGIVDSVSPIDPTTVRMAEWANLQSKELVEPQTMPDQAWVGGTRVQKPADAKPGDGGGTEQNNEGSGPTPGGTYIQYVVDHASHDVTVKVVDRASGEVTRTIPPEELAKYARESGMVPGMVLETQA